MARCKTYIIGAPMCGIFGAVAAGFAPRWGLGALDAIAHRGPDGSGHYHDPDLGLFLGHRRLSIIDLSPAGAQPMANEDGSLHLVFNGEIYNFEALRSQLVAKGHSFKSRCDAEVILHLYEEEGIDLLDSLHGMFAFALFDAPRRTLWLARDRLGIKPLYYYDDGKTFCFASELKAIKSVPGLDLEPDVTAYWDYLTYQFVPAPKTIYRRASKLPAAHHLQLVDGRCRVERYWDVSFKVEDEHIDEGEALEALEALLSEVIREHLVSDVEIGAFLSAGIDSSLVTALANRIAKRPLRAFTIGFPERENDEADGAARIADQIGSPHLVGSFSLPEIRESVPLLPGLFDEPFADHSALPMVGLCRHAAREVKVVLSGDGGDETHLGYERYAKYARREQLYARADRVPGLKRIARSGPARTLPWLRNAAEDPLGRPHRFSLGIPREAKRMILDVHSPELEGYDDYWLVRQHAREGLSDLQRQQYLDLMTLLPDQILTKVDRTAMRFGLEVRPPLLDHRLVQLAAGLPGRLKLRDGVGKPLLRALVARILPGAVDVIGKRGFSMPLKHFVRDEGLFRLSGDVDVFGAFHVDRRRVERVFTPARDSHKLWMLHGLASFLAWHEGAGAPGG